MLFGKDPASLYPGLGVRIGRFGASVTDLRFQEVIEGNLIYCLQETLTVLNRKFLIKPIRFEGILRIEDDQYPLSALREALLNALVHRRYQSGVHVQIRVYDERLVIWNAGPLPEEITLESLLGQHASYPRNPLIADVCFKAGYIDSWGRGIEKISNAFSNASLPAPIFEENSGGMRVTLTARNLNRTPISTKSKQGKSHKGLESGLESTAISPRVLKALMVRSLSKSEIAKTIGHKSISQKLNDRIRELLSNALIERTIPDKPTSRLQKYRLTEKGRLFIQQ